MRKLIFIAVIFVAGCGYTSVGNDGVCQPKKIHHNTPLICGNYDTVDISLGVMRDGVGSMSTHDMTLSFDPRNQRENEAKLEQAIKAGKLVKLSYNDRRFSICQETEQVTDVEIIETSHEVVEDAEQHKRDVQKQIEALVRQLEAGTP